MPKKVKTPESEMIEEDGTTAAAQSLAPNSAPADDARSRTELMAAILGDLAKIEVSDLAKLHDQVLAQNSKQFASSIPDGRAEELRSTIDPAVPPASASLKAAVKEDVENLFSGEQDLSEEFREKTATLFEAAVDARVAVEVARLEEQVSADSDSLIEHVTVAMIDKLDSYLNVVTEEWLKENEVAVESSLRNELTMEFIEGLKGLFAEHYIEIPEDKVDVVENLSQKVDRLSEQLDSAITEINSLREEKVQRTREDIVSECADSLSLAQAEKLWSLSESIDFEDEDTFKKKVLTLRESAFTQKARASQKTGTRQLTEATEDQPEAGVKYTDANVRRYAEQIARSYQPA